MASHFVTRFSSAATGAWSWWWAVSNKNDQLARAALTFCATLLAISWCCYMLMNRYRKKGDLSMPLPPGPRGLPLVGYLPFLDPNLHRQLARLSQTYGPIINLQLGCKTCVVVSSPLVAKEVLKDHDTIFSNRDMPAVAATITYGGIDIAWSNNGPNWRMVRKVCVREMLNNTRLDSLYGLRRQEVRQCIKYMYAKAGTPINIGEQMFITMLNLLLSMLWGGTLKGKERTDVGSEFRKVVEEVVAILGAPNISDLFPILAPFDLQGLERRMEKSLVWFDRIFDSVINQRTKIYAVDGSEEQGKNTESNDFLQLLLRIMDEGDSKMPLTMNHVKAIFMDIMVGGTDSTSTTEEWAMAEMMKHPGIMRKAQEELEEVVGMNNMVEESHLPKLHYLNAVVKEVNRLHSVIPLLVPRSPSVSCTVGGFTIPKGARVLVNAWAIHRDPRVWKDPLEFQPERFLNDCKLDSSGNDHRYLPFGSGRRICAGISLAERMLLYSLASLVHSFEWRLPEGERLDLSEKFGIVLKKATPLVAIPSPRLSNIELYS